MKLAAARPIDRIVVWNRTDEGVGIRLAGARVQLLDDARKVVWQAEVAEPPSPKLELATERSEAGGDRHGLGRLLAGRVRRGRSPGPQGRCRQGLGRRPRQKEPHEAVFALKEPLDLASTDVLTIRLEHGFRDPGYALGRFRLSVTRDPSAIASGPGAGRRSWRSSTRPPDARSAEGREALARHYRSIAPALQPVRDEIARLEKARPEIPTLPVMVELPAGQAAHDRIS